MSKWLVGLLTTAILTVPLLFDWAPLEVLKLKTFDALVEDKEPSGYFSILNITEDDITREGGYPLSRQRLSKIQIELLRKV